MAVSCQWLYNTLQKEIQRVIIVDCRDYSEYEKGHIISSICMPPELGLNEDGEEDFVDLTELDVSYFKHPQHFPQYETRGGKHLVVYNDSDHNMWIGHVISCMDVEGIVTNVQAMEEGFDEFKLKYPFLITTNPDPRSLFSVPGFPFPIELEYNLLYVSIDDNEIVSNHIKELNITSLWYIGDKPTIPVEYSDLDIHQLEDSHPFTPEFAKKFIDMMETSKKNGNVVLIHSNDHQNKLSICILYLLEFKNTPLREAYNIVLQSYWKEGFKLDSAFIEWLSKEESRILGKTSITKEEIQSGHIVEVPASSCSIS